MGATTLQDCVCDAGFYLSMLADADWCLPLPTGANCSRGAGMTSACTCLAVLKSPI